MVSRIFIIAEAGVNHNGDLKLAHELIDAASSAGADAVKFQTFNTDLLAGKFSLRASYQKNTAGEGDQASLLRSLELKEEWYPEIVDHCSKSQIEFMSTPFHKEAADLLAPLIRRFKIGSGDLTDIPFLQHVASLGKPVILSTGMADMQEIRTAFSALGEDKKVPLTLLHCTSQYPAPFASVNLNAMATLRSEFKVPVGYSDHTAGISVPIAAAAMGATVIEKHFTIDRNLPGPDHKASLTPSSISAMIRSIREVEEALGSSKKCPTSEEEEIKRVSRKSIVAATSLKAGSRITESMLAIKRPGTGISPGELSHVIGKKLNTSAEEDQPLRWEMLDEE